DRLRQAPPRAEQVEIVLLQRRREPEPLHITPGERNREHATCDIAREPAAAEDEPEGLDLGPLPRVARGEPLGSEREWDRAVEACFLEDERDTARARGGGVG